MKKILYTFLGLAMLSSCSDYLDVNDDPNNPKNNQMSPENLLASSLTTPFRVQAINMNDYGNVMSNSWAANVNAFTGGYRNEFTMDFTTSTRSVIWDNLYIGIGYLDNVIKSAKGDHKYDNYVAVAKIMKSYYMQYIVDLYGDAPYSDAFQRGENLTPKYDDDKAIYFNLISEIIAAKDMINNPDPAAEPLNTQDVMLHGNLGEWVHFANTIELKMWLRLSNLTDAQLGTDLAALKATRLPILAGEQFISADVTINPGYSNAVLGQNNPFYSVWGPSATGSTTGTNRNFSIASDYIAKTLMGTQNNANLNSVGVLDPRRARIFRGVPSSSANIVGCIQGDVTIAAGGTAPATLSLVGVGVTGYTGANAADAHLNGSTKDGFVMTLAEAEFLQSEAAVTYGSYGFANGKAHFDAGITASFAYHSRDLATVALSDLNPAGYLAAIDTHQGLGWTATANKVEAIMTQKWIALCGIHGIEPFLGIVRTGFPKVPLAITANHTSKPRRLLYPTSEYTANSANVPNVALSEIFSVNSTSPFWVTQ